MKETVKLLLKINYNIRIPWSNNENYQSPVKFIIDVVAGPNLVEMSDIPAECI